MVKCEQIIYGLFNGGYKLIQSKGVDNLLSEESLKTLYELGKTERKKETIIPLHFPTEKVISISYLTPTQDEYGRNGMFNHTILITVKDYVELMQPANFFTPYFIQYLDKPPKLLEPIEIEK